MTLGQNMVPVNGGAGRVPLGSGPNWAPTVILEAKPVVSQTDLITRDPDGTYTECQGGPIPKVLSIEHIAGNTAIKVQWEVTVCVVPDCIGGTANDPQKQLGILSNKWSCADDIDENFYLRSRMFVGELKLARPVVNPHDFRTIVVPPLTPGMRIKSMNFRASEDALTLQYSVTHEEVSVTAPYPATGIRISHKVSHAEYAIEIDELLAITLQGPRDVDKRQLVILAAHIAAGKLKTAELNNKTFRLMRYEMADESGTNQQNQVTVMYQVKHITAEADAFPNQNAIVGITQRFGQPINGTMIAQYDNLRSIGNRPNESPPISGPIGVAGAFSTHLQSTCTYDHSANRGVMGDVTVTNVLDQTKIALPTIPNPTLQVWTQLADLPDSNYSSSHRDGIYQTYEIDTHTQTQGMIIQLPVSEPYSLGSGGGGFVPNVTTQPPTNSTPLNQASATTGDDAVFVRLGRRQSRKTVRIVAKRHEAPPKLPPPTETFRDAQGVLHVLLDHQVVTQEPIRLPDDTLDYVVRAEYHYGMSRVPQNVRFQAPDFANPESLQVTQSRFNFSLADIYSSAHSIG